MKFAYKVFSLLPPQSSTDCITDWQGPDYPAWDYTHDLQECLAQPYRVAAVPVLFNQPGSYSYNLQLCHVDWSQFDLVVLSDIEYSSIDLITKFAQQAGIKNYLVALGGVNQPAQPDNFIFRPWWIFQHMRLNQYHNTESDHKPYLFEALLGARRAHRTYVMARFQANPVLLDQSIVSYRKEFGYDDNDPSLFLDQKSCELIQNYSVWPYISPNLTDKLEVSDTIRRDISEITPWTIYNQTYYSICCETLFQHFDPVNYNQPGPYFLTEKTAKVLLANRLFIMFGPMHTLRFLHELGFRTFGDILDESYDDCADTSLRLKLAFDQVEWLAQQDPKYILQATHDIRTHNYKHLFEYQRITKNTMHRMILDKIPEQYKLA